MAKYKQGNTQKTEMSFGKRHNVEDHHIGNQNGAQNGKRNLFDSFVDHIICTAKNDIK